MNEISEDIYIRYFECLRTTDKDICDQVYLPKPKPKPKPTCKDVWKFRTRGNFLVK